MNGYVAIVSALFFALAFSACQQPKSSSTAAGDNGISAQGRVPGDEVSSAVDSTPNDVEPRVAGDGKTTQRLPEGACHNNDDCADKLDDVPQCRAAECANDTGAGQCVLVDVPNGQACDDGNECTGSDTCNAGQCSGTPVPGCGGIALAENQLCAVSGKAGQTVGCPVELVHATKDSRRATGLQFNLTYDPNMVNLLRFSCINTKLANVDSCDLLYQLVPGHTLSVLPKKGEWDGTVAAAMYKLGDPLPITDAYNEEDAVVGNSHVLTAVFELKADLAKGEPSPVSLSKVTVADHEAIKIKVQMKDGIIQVLDD